MDSKHPQNVRQTYSPFSFSHKKKKGQWFFRTFFGNLKSIKIKKYVSNTVPRSTVLQMCRFSSGPTQYIIINGINYCYLKRNSRIEQD